MKNLLMLQYIDKMKVHLFFGLAFLASVCLSAQNTAREELTPYLSDLSEEILLHTDRTLYVSGESVWFNAEYLVNGRKAQTKISKVLYVELFNSKAEPVIQKKFKIKNHSVQGMLEIPEGATPGNYVLRAYTKFQRNNSHYDYAYSYLVIFNPGIAPDKELKQDEPSLRILPEGNEILTNTTNRFAVKLDQPSQVDSLLLINDAERPVRKVRYFSNGLAEVNLPINDSVGYFLKAYTKNGDSLTVNFPEADDTGYGLTALIENGSLHYQTTPKGKNGPGSLVIEIYSTTLQRLYKKEFNTEAINEEVSLGLLSDGLNFVVLKNGNSNEILNLRTVYNFEENPLLPQLSMERRSFKTRQKVELMISPDSRSPHDLLDLSVAVSRHGTGSNHRSALHQHVMANPWLIKDFLSKQVNPRIFKKQIEVALLLFDDRIFDSFKNILKEKTQTTLEYLPEIKDVTVSGIIRNKNSGEPVPHQRIYGSVLFNNPQFHIYETNKKGEFVFSLNDLNGLQDIFLCPVQTNEEAMNYEIKIKQDFDPRFPEFKNTSFPFDQDNKAFLEEIDINYQLNLAFNETLEERHKRQNDRRHYYLFGKERISRRLDNYVELDEMWDVLYEVIPHVKPVRKKGDYELKIMDDNSWVLPGSPLILLDNVPIFDVSKIMDLHPSQVDKIEVIDRTYLLGSYAINGVLLITTKTDNFGGTSFPDASVFAEFQTLASERKFKKVTYNSSGTKKQEREPDFRTLLYWNPELKLSGGQKNISFYTSDRKGKYDVIIKGTNKQGEPIFIEETITVE